MFSVALSIVLQMMDIGYCDSQEVYKPPRPDEVIC